MVNLGSFGDVAFEASEQLTRSFEGFTHDAGARLASSDIVGREPLVEWLGPDGQGVNFTLRLAAALGVDPRGEYENLLRMNDAGKASVLVIGGRPWGGSGVKWIIKSLSGGITHFARNGAPLWIDVAVTLQRYVAWGTVGAGGDTRSSGIPERLGNVA